MIRSFLAALATPWFLCILASEAPAQAVHLVSGGSYQAFPTIQGAVDAAADGGVVLISGGTGAGLDSFVLDGKGLNVFALPSDGVPISGFTSVVVHNQVPGQRVVLSGLKAQDTSLKLRDATAPIFVQDSSFLYTQNEWLTFDCIGGKGRAAVDVIDCERITLVGCAIEGGPGWSTFEFSDCPGGEGGDGLDCANSIVAVYDCGLYGGTGGNAKASPGDGGDGINITHYSGGSSTVFASNCTTKGGAGGQNVLYPNSQGCGGPGVEVWTNDLLIHLETTFTSGDSNNCAEPPLSLQGGLESDLQDNHRGFLAPTFAAAGSLITTGFYGQPGDVVWVFLSTGEKFRLFPFGVLHLPVFTPLPAAAGVVPGSGELLVQLDLSTLPPSVDPQLVTLQGFALGVLGSRRLTRPRQLLVIDPGSGPDCNGNGNNDYLDIIGGISLDGNYNLVPDECPGG